MAKRKILHRKTGYVEFTKNCKGPLIRKCEKCKYFWADCETALNYTNIPWYIIDYYQPRLSKPAWKILCFVARKADFRIKSNHFGRCWLRYEQIAKGTRVAESNMGIYMRELKKFKLLEITHSRHSDGVTVKTTNHFTVTWCKREKELKKSKCSGGIASNLQQPTVNQGFDL